MRPAGLHLRAGTPYLTTPSRFGVRLKEIWSKECQEWSRRSLAGKRYAYLWVDGMAENPSNPPIIGEYYYYRATSYDADGDRESAPSNDGSG